MNKDKVLQENLIYIERFQQDLDKIRLNLNTRYSSKSFDDACEEIFNNVRARCAQEIESLKSENSELAQFAQDYSNELLKIIAKIKEKNYEDLRRKKYQTELLNELIESSSKAKADIDLEIKDLEESKVKPPLSPTDIPEVEGIKSDPPPVRETPTGKKIRKVGEKPPIIKRRK